MLSLAETPSHSDTETFRALFLEAQKDLTRYVYSLVRDRHAAEDVMQELAIALWRKFDEFDQDRPFLPWACRFAFYQALKHRQSNQRRRESQVSEDFFVDVPQPTLEDGWWSARLEALDDSLEALPIADRELIHCRYQSGETIQQMAKRTKISAHKLYHALDRIRGELMDSINQSMRLQGWEC